jgi:hypothetical protein
MNPLLQTFWDAMLVYWPTNAVAKQGNGNTIVVWYPMPIGGRPNSVSREVVVLIEQRAVQAMAAAEPHERAVLAKNAARAMRQGMAAYDPHDEAQEPFVVIISDVALGL